MLLIDIYAVPRMFQSISLMDDFYLSQFDKIIDYMTYFFYF